VREQRFDIQAQALLERMRSAQSVIVCVGAGASYAAGMPTWRDLSRQLLERVTPSSDEREEVERFLSASDTRDVLLYLQNQLGHNALADSLRDALAAAHLQPSKLHSALATLPSTAFVTTNFDSLIERSLEVAGKPATRIVSDADLAHLKGNVVPVVKLQGTVDEPSTLVFSLRDYDQRQRQRSGLDAYLRTLFASSVVLFVGFSVQSIEFQELFQSYRGSSETTADWVVLGPLGNSLTHRLWEARGVLFVDLNYDEIPGFIQAIASRLKRPPHSEPAMAKAKRIFLSHGGDSRLAVMVKKVAESAGCEVVSLEDVPSMGRTIYEKFEQLADSASAAVIILGPDETVRVRGRPERIWRQNAVFELGFLVGKLGRRRVLVVLASDAVRLPTDLAGMQFVVGDPDQPNVVADRVRQWLDNAES
jgi:hypothetical protein